MLTKRQLLQYVGSVAGAAGVYRTMATLGMLGLSGLTGCGTDRAVSQSMGDADAWSSWVPALPAW